jgi:undecaprenyl-phosphate galactose phosphotransferase
MEETTQWPPITSKLPTKHFIGKRIFDVFFSLLILTAGAPVFIVIALIVRCSSKGSIFYSHERIGRGGIPFRCYKFRTMHPDADIRLEEILKSDPYKKKEWEKNRKLRTDPRLISVGAFLRRTSLDELPQFWNVLKGELSIVGPRPVVREEIVKHFGPRANKILSIRPGLTGIWQVSGRSNTSYARRVALDEQYVDTRSFWLDMKLIALTIPRIFSQNGAY